MLRNLSKFTRLVRGGAGSPTRLRLDHGSCCGSTANTPHDPPTPKIRCSSPDSAREPARFSVSPHPDCAGSHWGHVSKGCRYCPSFQGRFGR